MPKTLLYSRTSYLTGKKLGQLLGIKATRNHKKLSPDTEVVVRYGHRHGMFVNDTEVNSKLAIQTCADSVLFHSFCKDAGFYCPEYISPKDFEGDTFPVFLRKRKHFGGKDIIVVNDNQGLEEFVQPDSYIVVPANIRYEIRIHVINKEVARIFSKVSGDSVEEQDYPIRTAHKGWKYSLVPPPYNDRYKKAREVAIELATALNLSFGAFDLGFDKDAKKYIIFEVNTAPSLINNENTLNLYVEFFKGLL